MQLRGYIRTCMNPEAQFPEIFSGYALSNFFDTVHEVLNFERGQANVDRMRCYTSRNFFVVSLTGKKEMEYKGKQNVSTTSNVRGKGKGNRRIHRRKAKNK